jgi:OmpA-OmpF porin, OOP family
MKHFNLRTTYLRASLMSLGFAALCTVSLAQNAANPVNQNTGNYLNSGTTTTESVLKQTLPAVTMMPGTPSDGNARVSEPDYYNDLQVRINKLKTPPQTCLHQYHLAKSQAWLNFSRDQYHENAWQKSIQSTTFEESKRIVTALESKVDPGMDTPLVSDATKLRPDLWATADKLKLNFAKNGGSNYCCANLDTAFCEVQLVWSGHALANLGGWKRANGHIRMAEDLCHEAEKKVCAAPAPVATPMALITPVAVVAPPPVVKPAPAPLAPAVPAPIVVSLKAIALFYHDKHTAADMLPESRAQLDAFSQQFKLVKVNTMTLTGFADISNSTGDQAYNEKLSAKRAATVKAYLQAQGVQMDDKGVAHQADRNPVKFNCAIPQGSNGVLKGKAAQAALANYYACMQPNRRVEVEVTGVSVK